MFVKLPIFAVVLLSVQLPGYSEKQTVPDEKWGYVEVRKNAFMFWWFQGAQVPSVERPDKPLVLWLQGGPGGSGTGYGNFVEIGPLDLNLEPRNTTWLKEANLLFVDNPVGSGFSYVSDYRYLTRNISEITKDLMTFIKSFLKEMPVFQSIPLFIIGESYGGKMIANFAVALYEAVESGNIHCQLKGVGLGDSLISFPDTVEAYAPYLYSLSLLDGNGFKIVNEIFKKSAEEARQGNYVSSMKLNDVGLDYVAQLTDDVDVYNVLKHNIPNSSLAMKLESETTKHHYKSLVSRLYESPLSQLMNGPIRKKLGIIPPNVTFGGQSLAVFQYQYGDCPSSVLKDVSKLINYQLKVVIYEGQLDLICGATGAETWVKKLQWPGLKEFEAAPRKPLYTAAGERNKKTAAFVKSYQKVDFYYILKSGHMVPVDAPEMALEMLKRIIG